MLTIKDLPVSKELDTSEMSAVHGGADTGLSVCDFAKLAPIFARTGGPVAVIALAGYVDLSVPC